MTAVLEQSMQREIESCIKSDRQTSHLQSLEGMVTDHIMSQPNVCKVSVCINQYQQFTVDVMCYNPVHLIYLASVTERCLRQMPRVIKLEACHPYHNSQSWKGQLSQ